MSLDATSTPVPALLSDAELVQLRGRAKPLWRHRSVEALQLPCAVRWTSDRGSELVATAGSYLVADGTRAWSVEAQIFESTYRRGNDGRWVKVAPAHGVCMAGSFAVETLEGVDRGDRLFFGVEGEAWPVSSEAFVVNDYRGEPVGPG